MIPEHNKSYQRDNGKHIVDTAAHAFLDSDVYPHANCESCQSGEHRAFG